MMSDSLNALRHQICRPSSKNEKEKRTPKAELIKSDFYANLVNERYTLFFSIHPSAGTNNLHPENITSISRVRLNCLRSGREKKQKVVTQFIIKPGRSRREKKRLFIHLGSDSKANRRKEKKKCITLLVTCVLRNHRNKSRDKLWTTLQHERRTTSPIIRNFLDYFTCSCDIK